MIARNERNKASGEWLLDVMRWEKTGENSAHCSGEAVRCVGWGEANKVARRWMMRGAGFYVSISIADSALRGLEIYGRKYEAKAAPFSSRRAWYSGHSDDLCMTVDSDPLDSRYRALTGGPLDAPGCLPGGACDSLGALFGGSPQVVALREYISDEVPDPFAPGREKHAGGVDRLCSTGFWFVNMEQCGALDAPQFIAAGSFHAFEDRDCGTVRAPRILMRAGWL